MKRTLALFMASFLISSATYSQCKLDYSNYSIVLNEEFDTYGGSVANLLGPTSIWKATFDDPNAGWGNEYFDPSQVFLVSDGTGGYRLRLKAERTLTILHLPGRTKDDGSPKDIYFKSGALNLKNSWLLPASAIGVLDNTSSCTEFSRDPRGWAYGMFEIRCKLPSGGSPSKWDTWPAFWLVGHGELDILDNIGENASKFYNSGKIDWTKLPWENPAEWYVSGYCGTCGKGNHEIGKAYKAGDNINSGWGPIYTAKNDIIPLSSGMHINTIHRNLETEYTTFTAVWTPTKISFFVEGREMYTLNGDYAKLGNGCPLNLIVDLQMFSSGADSDVPFDKTYEWDIDYIRVYKPNQLDYTLSYKTDNEYVNHDITKEDDGFAEDVNAEANSICINPDNPDEIFYRGADNWIYAANKISGRWKTKKLHFNDGVTSVAAGEIRYLRGHDKIIYVGANGRINLFGRSTTEPCGFYHWYLRSDWWIGTYDMIAAEPGSLQVSDDGDNIFFKGTDSKMHHYLWNASAGTWNHSILYHPPAHGTNSFVSGDLVVDPLGSNNIMYKGFDKRLQQFWKDASGAYHHVYVDNPSNPSSFKINDFAGSTVFATSISSLLYIGSDNKIQSYKWDGTGWYHDWLPYSYGSPSLGYPNGDYAKGSIDWDDEAQKVFYGGMDGRIQSFSKNGSTWDHKWIDDYWNTVEYSSFSSLYPTMFKSSTRVGSEATNKSIFYTAYSKRCESCTYTPHLSYFKYQPCEYDYNNTMPYEKNLYRVSKESTVNKVYKNEDTTINFTLNPNPTSTFVTINSNNDKGIVKNIEIFDITGRIVMKEISNKGSITLDVSLLAEGVYVMKINAANKNSTHKLLKK